MESNRAILSIPKGKIRSPWLGVNVSGARPIVLATETVRASLKGVTVTDAAAVETQRSGTLHGGGFGNHRHGEAVRALEVTYVHGERRDILKHRRGGHGKVTFYDLGEVGLSVREWARKQRERIAGNGNGQTARAKKVAVMVRRLEKEKRGLYLHVPKHPLLPHESHVYEGSAR